MSGILIREVEYRGETVDLLIDHVSPHIMHDQLTITRVEGEVPGDVTVIEAKGLIVSKGFYDDHVHFRDPGFTEKEDLLTGARAAVAGGYSSVTCMPNTNPVIDCAEAVSLFDKRWRELALPIMVYTHGALTVGERGESLTNMWALADQGVFSLSDDGEPVLDEQLLADALRRTTSGNFKTSLHCEETPRSQQKVREVLGEGKPYEREPEIIALSLKVLADTPGNRWLHFQHISMQESVRLIADAKKRGLNVTAEVAPHHLLLCRDDIPLRNGEPDANWKMNPPLRSREDMLAMRRALAEGIIDYIATDHAPHTPLEKARPWDQAPFGVIGLETAFGACMSLVHNGDLSFDLLLNALEAGDDLLEASQHLITGVTLIDPNHVWTVDPDKFYSKARNCPFAGMTFKGKPMYNIANGKILMAEGEVLF